MTLKSDKNPYFFVWIRIGLAPRIRIGNENKKLYPDPNPQFKYKARSDETHLAVPLYGSARSIPPASGILTPVLLRSEMK